MTIPPPAQPEGTYSFSRTAEVDGVHAFSPVVFQPGTLGKAKLFQNSEMGGIGGPSAGEDTAAGEQVYHFLVEARHQPLAAAVRVYHAGGGVQIWKLADLVAGVVFLKAIKPSTCAPSRARTTGWETMAAK